MPCVHLSRTHASGAVEPVSIKEAIASGTPNNRLYIDKSRAAYWDGRNDLGEKVSSGVYF